MSKKDSLGKRMKEYYEQRSQTYLVRRMPVIIRLDGVAFHTLTKNLKDRFDPALAHAMSETTANLVRMIQGCVMGYWQSDEISLLLIDYEKLTTDAWFGYNVQKIVSNSASMCSVLFNLNYARPEGTLPVFDSRAFNIPKEDVNNYFLWRQLDAQRNSLNALCSMYFSHRQLHNKNSPQRHEMLHSIGKNWTTELTHGQKNGYTFYRGEGYVEGHEFRTNNLLIDELIRVGE